MTLHPATLLFSSQESQIYPAPNSAEISSRSRDLHRRAR